MTIVGHGTAAHSVQMLNTVINAINRLRPFYCDVLQRGFRHSSLAWSLRALLPVIKHTALVSLVMAVRVGAMRVGTVVMARLRVAQHPKISSQGQSSA